MFEQEYKKLGLRIAYLRKLHGYTQAELAERIGISRTHLSNIEATKMQVGISLDVIFSIAKELNVSLSCIFEGIDDFKVIESNKS